MINEDPPQTPPVKEGLLFSPHYGGVRGGLETKNERSAMGRSLSFGIGSLVLSLLHDNLLAVFDIDALLGAGGFAAA